jgi:chemotaxis protein methyltransferase CheR
MQPAFAADDGPREFAFSVEDFNGLRALVHRVAGISLAENKRNLVYGRLSRRLRTLRLGSFAEYRRLLESDPYSIAMTVREMLGDNPRVDLRILAADLDSEVLNRARNGVYGTDNVKGIMLAKYFDAKADKFQVKPTVSRLITFKQLNLMHELPMRGPLDIIFCRNVVIYFDKDTQRRLFQRYARLQRPGDLLFIGHSESLFRVSDAYSLVGTTIYQRNEVEV